MLQSGHSAVAPFNKQKTVDWMIYVSVVDWMIYVSVVDNLSFTKKSIMTLEVFL